MSERDLAPDEIAQSSISGGATPTFTPTHGSDNMLEMRPSSAAEFPAPGLELPNVSAILPHEEEWLYSSQPDPSLIRQVVNSIGDPLLFSIPSSPSITIRTNNESPWNQPRKIEMIPPDVARQHWFTFSGADEQDPTIRRDIQSPTQIDDEIRQRLHTHLYRQPSQDGLPSTEFLNLSIQKYFSKFHPIFPLLHLPTFRPSTQNSLILLAICCIGSFFFGSKKAITQGRRISEQLNQTILNSWITSVGRQQYQALPLIQDALIGQTYGILSGRPRDLAVVASFHGTVTSWAKQQEFFNAEVAIPDVLDHGLIDPAVAWIAWIKKEERNRAAVALHMHDYEMTRLFITEPSLHNAPNSIPCLAPHSIWDAASAIEWAKAVRTCGGPFLQSAGGRSAPRDAASAWCELSRNDHLNVIVQLKHICSTVIDNGYLAPSTQILQYVEGSLTSTYAKHLRFRGPDLLSVRPLWHSAFILLSTDIRRLELAIGKKGSREASENFEYASTWAASLNSQRAILHGALLLRQLEPLPICAVSNIHVSSSLYHAAIVWYCYLRYAPESRAYSVHGADEFQELKELAIDVGQLVMEVHEFKSCRPLIQESTVLLNLVDMLRRVGHWGISRSLATLLTLLITGSTDLDDPL
ncbi:uncharacterized protein DSM5745_04597 [Aspergillus mulundensis]|uniref:Xylanolytic transcriptional activator regulatory domain-containing protein n=1 Tax=Aspergillus mulundensis TaxID=1810919 RepID=A0A3D8S4C9_9EURO|nr:hypothetical protein DSM5745_04597 [Aspergillus mulundensis]RDW81040.1 hypothetical protein DSM5745_04597 [Aspergillus mulundensis]